MHHPLFYVVYYHFLPCVCDITRSIYTVTLTINLPFLLLTGAAQEATKQATQPKLTSLMTVSEAKKILGVENAPTTEQIFEVYSAKGVIYVCSFDSTISYHHSLTLSTEI